jgi:hypothetical protein
MADEARTIVLIKQILLPIVAVLFVIFGIWFIIHLNKQARRDAEEEREARRREIAATPRPRSEGPITLEEGLFSSEESGEGSEAAAAAAGEGDEMPGLAADQPKAENDVEDSNKPAKPRWKKLGNMTTIEAGTPPWA